MYRFKFSTHFCSLRKIVSGNTSLGQEVLQLQSQNSIVKWGFIFCHRSFCGSKMLENHHSISSWKTAQTARVPMKLFSTTQLGYSSEREAKSNQTEKLDEENKPLTQRQKLARIFAMYGSTAVVFHTAISLTSLGICYTIVSSGIDMVALLQKVGIASEAGLQSTLATGASTFVIAYACHKVFMPVRIFLTVTCTPIIVRKLRSMGLLKEKTAGS